MKRLLITTALLLAGIAGSEAKPLTLAVVAPKTGMFAPLGDQVRHGAQLAAARLSIDLVEIDENCEAGSGPDIAKKITEAEVTAAIGFLCSESLEGGLPLLAEKNIPAISLSVRWKGLMEDAAKQGWPFFRLAPTAEAEVQILTDFILRDWQSEPVALIEDGTIRGRELTEAIRNSLEERGLKPVFTDTLRPGQEQQLSLVRRLQKAGATHVFIGGDRNDVAIIARDAAAEKIPLTILAGDAMQAANEPVPLRNGVMAVALTETPEGPSAADVTAALIEQKHAPDGYLLPAHAAVTIVADAVGISSAMGTPLTEALAGTMFETVIGPITFTEGHELAENPYRLVEWKDGAFVPIAAGTQ
ncbi:Extracellular ligand-binding receptor [Rhizobium sp. PDO1-076]|uniref:branched-chain amino acid ABC transporter substrate-binding protein n=1 Tax=Rhizobium sp. PDO1-076 TaxID=1125979 RepID=UPI00024E3B63|nr:branched-chain amino acid ABC transporter substrate-binding protein [Rhizobium sp. PDO1-076]EHS50062.1 Extracellular ligand-binding receptor [Rhizobium sp. PDO1-076]